MEVWAPGIVQNKLTTYDNICQTVSTKKIGLRLLSKLKTQNPKTHLIMLFIKITKQYLTLQKPPAQGSKEIISYQQHNDLIKVLTNQVELK